MAVLEPYLEFCSLVEECLEVLRGSSQRIQDALNTNRRLEREFEHQVLLTLQAVARAHGSQFYFSPIHSEHGFPDIIAEHSTGLCYGVEIKTAKTWQTNGNSINSSISDDRIEAIVVIFCKTSPPIEFAYKSYEEAITGIQVTHYPRYVLNMKANPDESILKHMNISYAQFKKLPVPEKIALIRSYYEQQGKADGKWWIY
jgi:hypothetical protein